MSLTDLVCSGRERGKQERTIRLERIQDENAPGPTNLGSLSFYGRFGMRGDGPCPGAAPCR